MPKLISKERICQAVDIILSMQNCDGRFSSFEKIREPSYLEWINSAEIFGNIMIEYNYPKCTSSALTALNTFIQIIAQKKSSNFFIINFNYLLFICIN